jgi:hypothetical protein
MRVATFATLAVIVTVALLGGCSGDRPPSATSVELAALPRAVYVPPGLPIGNLRADEFVFRLSSVSATPSLCEATYALYSAHELSDKQLRSHASMVEYRLVVEDQVVSCTINEVITLKEFGNSIRPGDVPLLDGPIPLEQRRTARADDGTLYAWADAHAAAMPDSRRSSVVIRRLGLIDGVHVATYSNIYRPATPADADRLMASGCVKTQPNPEWGAADVSSVRFTQGQAVPVLK